MVGSLLRLLAMCGALGVAACAAPPPPDLPPVPTFQAEDLSHVHFKAVLIAGDNSITVFDNATALMRDRLRSAGVGPAGVTRLSAASAVIAEEGVRSATPGLIAEAIEAMRPGAGEGCLVFATSHGAFQHGLYLARTKEFLTPAALDAALARGCGNAPTVAVISGCFTGSFVKPPMNRPNRIILTAAREDRTSFGCGADQVLTYYDRCFFASLDHPAGSHRPVTWADLNAQVVGCVRRQEAQAKLVPSEPQSYFGQAVAGLPLFH